MGDVIVWAVLSNTGAILDWFFHEDSAWRCISADRRATGVPFACTLADVSSEAGEEKILERFLDRPGGSARLSGVEAMRRDEKDRIDQ